MTCTSRVIFRMLLVCVCLLPLGCPPPVPECTQEELADLRYEERVVGGDAGRIVFERAGYPRSICNPPRNRSIELLPADRTWVLVEMPTLTRTTVSPPLPGPVDSILTDAHWAVITDHTFDVITVRDLDTGSERVVAQGITDPYQFATSVFRPWVFVQDFEGGTVMNVDTGVSRQVPSSLSRSALSARFAVYPEIVNPQAVTNLRQRLVLLNLDIGEQTTIKEDVPSYDQLKVLATRVVWVEETNILVTRTIQVHDLQSGTTSPLIEVTLDNGDYRNHEFASVDDVGESGVVIRRGRTSGFPDPSTAETLEFVMYDGSSRMIDSRVPEADLDEVDTYLNHVAQFAGPYVVYAKGGRWMIYDPADGSTREVEPFASISSQP